MLNLSNPFIKLLLPSLGIVVAYLVARKKFKYSFRDDLLFVTPGVKSLLIWIPLYLIYMLGTDFVLNWRGPFYFQPWREQPFLTSIARVLAVGIIGPLAEEMIFRGLLLQRINQFKVNRWVSLVLVTVLWTILHIEYSFEILVLIFFDGLLLGIALYKSRSLLLPVILHIIWNLYAVW